MKKYIFCTIILFTTGVRVFAQKHSTPTLAKPEFSNEIYLVNKDSAKLIRLEKGNANMEMKAKMGGMENGYSLNGDKSAIRIKSSKDLSFIFYAGGKPEVNQTSSMADSLMRSMGLSSMSGSGMGMTAGMQPPISENVCELYSMKTGKGKRNITIQSQDGDPQAANGIIQSAPNLMQAGKGGMAIGVATVGIGVGMKLLGKGKKESIKYPINIKKIKDDFFEITIGKNLPKGEYGFVLGGSGGMDNSATLFAFAID